MIYESKWSFKDQKDRKRGGHWRCWTSTTLELRVRVHDEPHDLSNPKNPSASSQAVCVTRFDQRMRHVWVIRAVFRGICGEILALFQVRVGNLDTIPPWKVVGTLYLNSSCVSFKYFAFLSVCNKFELLGHDDLSVIFTVLLGFIAGYCKRFYRIISVNLLLQPFFFANFGVYPGLPLLGPFQTSCCTAIRLLQSSVSREPQVGFPLNRIFDDLCKIEVHLWTKK